MDLSKQFRGKYDTSIDKIKINNSPTFDDTDKANCLAQIFEESHKITADYRNENDNEVKHTVTSFNCSKV